MGYKEKKWFEHVRDGNYEQVKKFIEDGFKINTKTEDHYSETALIKATDRNNLDLVKLLLEHKANVNAKDGSGDTALIKASGGKNNIEIVKLLIENGADVNAKNKSKETALIEASSRYRGNFDIVKLLIENGADIHSKQYEGETPLFGAAAGGHYEIAKYLIELGADVNVRSSGSYDKRTALLEAIEQGHLEVAKILLENGADINGKDKYGRGVLKYAIYNRENGLELFQLLEQYGADIFEKDKEGKTPLIEASEIGHYEIVKYLIEKGVDVNQKAKDKNIYPISMAIQNNRGGILKLLISNGAIVDEFLSRDSINDYWFKFIYKGFYDGVKQIIKNGIDVNIKTDEWEKIKKPNALMKAVYLGYTEIVELLLENGAIINKKFFIDRSEGDRQDWDYYSDYEPITPLILATEKGHHDICSILINYGAKVNYGSGKFYTALVKAVQNNDPNIVRLLLENGANINCTSFEKYWTLLSLSSREGYTEIVKMLLEYGIFEIEDIGESLINAAKNGHYDIVKLFIENGADVNYKKDKGSKSVFHYTIAKGDLEFAKYLLDKGADINAKYESGYSDDKSTFSALTQYCEQVSLINGHSSFKKFLIDTNTIKFLIDNGCEFDKKKEGRDILLTAAYFADSNIIDMMLDLKVSPNSIGKKKRTILHELTEGLSYIKEKLKEDERFAKRSLSYVYYEYPWDTDLTKFYEYGYFINNHFRISFSDTLRPLTELFNQALEEEKVIYNKYFELLKVFVEKGVDVNKVDNNGNTPLHYAVNCPYTEIVEYLVENGAILNIKNKGGETAFDTAIYWKRINNANLLFDKGCLKDASEKEINDLLPKLMKLRYQDLIVKILEHPYETIDYHYILWNASYEVLLDVVKLAVERGADVNSKNDKHIEYSIWSNFSQRNKTINFNGATALIMTSLFSSSKIITYLISVGADVNITDDNGNTALMRAAEGGYLDQVKILIEAGAEINQQNKEGNTALILAAKERSEHALIYLVEQGADVNMCNKEKLTALYYVVNEWDNNLMKDFLIEHGATVEEYDADEEEEDVD